MTTPVEADADAGLDRPPTAWRVLRWTTLALGVVTVVATIFIGVRQADYASLEAALRSGAVDEVTVQSHAPGIEEPRPGVGTVRLQWRANWQTHSATVWNAGSESTLEGHPRPSDSDISGVIIGAPGPELRTLNPNVTLTQEQVPSTWGTLGNRDLYGAWAVLPGLLWMLTMLTLLTGPEPRWATRWAWTWLLLSPAVFLAVPAYLVWGARGDQGGWRLTGGWAFLVFLLASGS